MIIQLTGQAQELLGKTELIVITERVDDVALLLAQMMRMGLPERLFEKSGNERFRSM